MSSFHPHIPLTENLARCTDTQESVAAVTGGSAGPPTASVNESALLPLGNGSSSPAADVDAVPLPDQNAVDAEISTTSPLDRVVAWPIVSERVSYSTIGSNPTKPAANQSEIIDLCSGSDDGVPLPPKKRTKIDDAACDKSLMIQMEKSIAVADLALGAKAGAGSMAHTLTDVTGTGMDKHAQEKEIQQDEVKEEKDDDDDDNNKAGREPGAETSRQHMPQMSSADTSAGGVPAAKEVPVPTAGPHHGNKDMRSADTFSAEDVLPMEINGSGNFTTPRGTRSPADVKPIQRIETVRTPSGVKKRKMVGPFVVEETNGDLEDEGYGSFSSFTANANQLGVGGDGDDGEGKSNSCSNNNNSDANVDLTSGKSCPKISDPTELDDMEAIQRRRQSEDKCAEMSRRMRQDALANRGARAQEDNIPITWLSKDFHKDGLHSKTDITSLIPSSRPVKKGMTTPSSIISSPAMCPSKHTDQSDDDNEDDDDDLFGNDDDSTEAVEAQLEFVQAFANSKNGTVPSAADLSRSRQPCPSALLEAVKQQKADDSAHLDSQPKGERGLAPQDSTLPREKEPPCGRVRGIFASGIGDHDLEQTEKHQKRSVKDQSSRKWDRDAEVELGFANNAKLPARVQSVAQRRVIDSALGKDEARLLAAKNPLRAVPTTSGGLPRLTQIVSERTGTTGHRRGSNDHQPTLTQRNSSSPPSPHLRRPADNTFDEANWTRDANIQKRKRDIENLMNAWTATAKYWWMAFDTISPRCQKGVRAQAQELRRISDIILRGFSSRDKAERRITDIKAHMIRRARRHQMDTLSDREPTRQEIDREMVQLMGEEQCKRARMMLGRVLGGYERHQQAQKKKSHLKGACPNSESRFSRKTQPRTLSNTANKASQKTSSGPGKLEQNKDLELTCQKSAAWQKEDAKIEQIKERLARFEDGAEPARRDGSTKKVHFADQALWGKQNDETQNSETQESDEDEDETAPSFGRGEDCSVQVAPRNKSAAGDVARKTVGGKGLLSELRKGNNSTELNDAPASRPSAKKSLPAQNGPTQHIWDAENPTSDEWSCITGKSKALSNQLNSQKQVRIAHRTSETDDSQFDAADSTSEEVSSLAGEDDMAENDDGRHIVQYDIVADYECFDDYQDADLVPLGRHIDIKAALRQMRRVTTDVAASASRKHRQLRIIWDTDDFELAAQTVILPTGGECRVRMVKCWTLAADWPGKTRARTVVAPKVFYIVHETKTTSLRPPSDSRGDAVDDDLFGPENFEDLNAVIEKERDMCFSSRECANEVAKNRLMAFNRRHEAMKDYNDTGSTPDLVAYMEQIEHDKICFEQEKRFWIESKGPRKGKEDIKIWVEEMIADMPHI